MSTSLQQQAPGNPSPRTLHLYYTNGAFTQRHMVMTDSDKATALYDVSYRGAWSSIFSSKPHMTITRSSDSSDNNVEVGTVTFRSFSTPDLTIHDRNISLERTHSISRGRSFLSNATGTTLAWQYDSAVGQSMTCSDESNQWFARYMASHFSLSKGGVLELASPSINGILLDEIVVTVVRRVEGRRRLVPELDWEFCVVHSSFSSVGNARSDWT